MTILIDGDVVRVPFPHAEDNRRKPRPALVLATGLDPGKAGSHDLFRAVMIKSAASPSWPGDLPVGDLGMAGLPTPSVLRTHKLATLPTVFATAIGRVAADELATVRASVASRLRSGRVLRSHFRREHRPRACRPALQFQRGYNVLVKTGEIQWPTAYVQALNDAGRLVEGASPCENRHASGMRPTAVPITTEWPGQVEQWPRDIGVP